MNDSFPQRLTSLAGEVKALAAGHWMLLRQELAGKAALSKKQLTLMAAGAVAALTAVFLILAALTLLLTQLLVSVSELPPLAAGGISALIVAICFALTGWLVIRSGGRSIAEEGLAPRQTLQSLKSAANTLTNAPFIPSNPDTPMKTRQEFQETIRETAETVDQQARRAGRAVSDSARNLRNSAEPASLFAAVLSWADMLMTPRNRAALSSTLNAVGTMPRKYPASSALLGIAGLYLAWQKLGRSGSMESTLEFAGHQSRQARRKAAEAYESAQDSLANAFAAGRDIKEALSGISKRLSKDTRSAANRFSESASSAMDGAAEAYETSRETLSDSAARVMDTARQFREDAEDGLKKARDFAKDEPALVIAGGLALALGTVLLVKSSRR